MTPLEIFEYKNSWRPGYIVRLHSDLRSQATAFCKVHMVKHQWDVSHYTNVYEDTWMFERELEAQIFTNNWDSRFVNQ